MSPSATASRETHAPPLIAIAELSPADAARYAMFQHMIANHDWSMRAGPQGDECCHNAKLIGPRGSGHGDPDPVRFRLFGLRRRALCDAARPARHSTTCTQRFYRGYCSHNAYALAAAAANARGAAADARGVVAKSPGSSPRPRATRGQLSRAASSRTSPPTLRSAARSSIAASPARPSSSSPARAAPLDRCRHNRPR